MLTKLTLKDWEDMLWPKDYDYKGDGETKTYNIPSQRLNMERSKYTFSFYGVLTKSTARGKFDGSYNLGKDLADFLEGMTYAKQHELAVSLFAVAKWGDDITWNSGKLDRQMRIVLTSIKVTGYSKTSTFEVTAALYFRRGYLVDLTKYVEPDISGSGQTTGTSPGSGQLPTGSGFSSSDHFIGTPTITSRGSTNYQVSFYPLPELPHSTADQLLVWNVQSVRKVSSLKAVHDLTDPKNPAYVMSARDGGNTLVAISRRVIYANYAMLQGSLYWVTAGGKNSGLMSFIESPYTGEQVDIYSPLGVHDKILDTCPDVDEDIRRGI